MKNIRWIAEQLAPLTLRRWKVVFSCAILLLGTTAPGQSTQSSPSELAPEEIIARMEQRFEQQIQSLESYQDHRRYSVAHPLLRKPAYLLAEETFLGPEDKQFRVLERGGPSTVQDRVFSRLLQVERETARESTRPQVDLCRKNYDFTFEKYDPAADAYVFQAEPRGSNPYFLYLLRGKIWINAQDFAVQRIEGQPAQRPSFLVRQTHFVHEFAKFGDFWFPVHHRSDTDLLLFGRATLEIEYSDYQWQARQEASL